MTYREVEPSVEDWRRQIEMQPEKVAELLFYESRFGGLHVDHRGNVWNGGIGPGFGTSFRMLVATPEGERP